MLLQQMDILTIEKVTKIFPGVKALDEVDFSVKEGEIHCLCGENGAGKSTLMKIISGVYSSVEYAGTVLYQGKPTHYQSVKDSERDGISIIHQELALVPYLSIVDNIFLGHEKARFGVLNEYTMIEKARVLLERVRLQVSPVEAITSLSIGQQQLVEIAKALSKNVRMLILDEPTSSLNDAESEALLQLILEIKKSGVVCIMISHKLDELMKIADSITVLRDGRTIATHNMHTAPVDKGTIIKEMVGRSLTQLFPKREHVDIGDVLLEVKNWSVYHPQNTKRKIVDNASFIARRGEVVGVCGLMGAGRTELMMSVFGGAYGSRSEGSLYINGTATHLKSPKDAIRRGICYVSEDRKTLGLILKQAVRNNISNSSLRLLSRYGVVDDGKETHAAQQYVESMRIKTPSIEVDVSTLSGGNQQKVVLSRCLLTNPEVFIIDEPTRGIDVGAKYEIYSIINDLAKEGKSVIMISSELPEILGIADRIYVMNEGKIQGELPIQEATQEKIMHIILQK